jgi:hypothetical protein
MRLLSYLVVIALASSVPVLTSANGSVGVGALGHEGGEVGNGEKGSPSFGQGFRKLASGSGAGSTVEPLTLMDTAYMDAWSILNEDNSCSRFFGGSLKATLVLNKLANQIEHEPLKDSSIGIRMKGVVMNVMDAPTGISYRLFERVVINSEGPFYKRPAPSGNNAFSCGIFPPNTREARVSMLLHELAHLIRGADGNWLIPNDGNDPEKSRQNTATVEAKCVDQIKALEK